MLITSCATPPPITDVNINNKQHQLNLAALNHWQIIGKFGFKSPDKKPQSAYLSWQQNAKEYQFSLSSILGTSILSMNGSPELTTLKADGETYQDQNASELIWQITGWSLPVEHLPVWIKGQSLAADKVTLSEHGWINQLVPSCLNCLGWQINYSDYQLIEQSWLPHKIVMINPNKQIQVIIKVNTWSIN